MAMRQENDSPPPDEQEPQRERVSRRLSREKPRPRSAAYRSEAAASRSRASVLSHA